MKRVIHRTKIVVLALFGLLGGMVWAEVGVDYRTWILQNGGTPSATGGYYSTYEPSKAFDGVSGTTDEKSRYLGKIGSAYLVYGPSTACGTFTMTHYRVCQLTNSGYANDRAPTAWTLYGGDTKDGPWTKIESRSGVAWSGSPGLNVAAPAMPDCWREFWLDTPQTYQFYKIEFTDSRANGVTEVNIGVMEVEYCSGEPAVLPDGYEPVDCIIATGRDDGKQWINTGYTPAGTDSIQTKVNFTQVTEGRNMALYCTRESGSSKTFTCFLIKDGSDNKMKLRFDRYSTTANYYSMTIRKETDYEVVADGFTQNCRINDGAVEKTMASGTFTPNRPLILFASMGSSEIKTENLGNFGEFALYYFKVMDKDGHVKVDMVPCRETKDGGVAGLYDLQRNKFYPSETLTPFDYTIAEPPATPDTPSVDIKTGQINWTTSAGADAWYLERQIGTGEWESIYRAETAAACSYIDTPNALNVSYRIAASNVHAVVHGDAVNVRMPIYSIGFGAKTERFRGRFAPTKVAFPNSTVYSHSTYTTVSDIPAEYAGDSNLFTTYAYVSDYGGTKATATFTGLTPNKTYGVRVISMENWSGATVGFRTAKIVVNDVDVLTGMDAYSKVGKKIGRPCFWDAEGTSTAEGTMRVAVQNVKDDFILYGIELYELDAAAGMRVPELSVAATVDYAVIRCDACTGIGFFEIQMSDVEPSAGTEGTLLYAAAPVEVRDLSIAKGATRWYRARRKWMGKASPWSAWQSVTRPSSGDFRTVLRLNMDSENNAVVEGWELDKPYRQTGCSKIDGASMTTEVVTIPDTLDDPAPAEVYRTRCQSQVTDSSFKLGWTVSGFEPYAEIKVRLHLCEQWTGCSVGSRIFHLRSRYLRQDSLQNIDVFKLAGSKPLTAVVAEGTLYADEAGRLDLNVARSTGVPIIRGIELIAANANPVRLGGEIAECTNLDGTKSGRGRLYIPYSDNWNLTVTGNGKVSVWMDGQIKGTYALTGIPKTFFTGPLSEGTHDLHYELDADDSTCTFGWSTAAGEVGSMPGQSLAVLSTDEPVGTGDWGFAQLGEGATVPYAEATNAAFDSFRLSTTGNSMYYAKDDGTYLYRRVDGGLTEFTMTARFSNYSCDWTGAQTRIGIGVRDTLENGANGTFVSFNGFDATIPDRRLTYYSDLNVKDGFSIEGDASKFVTSGWNSLPIWMRVTRSNVTNGNHRYVFEYSHDGESWPVARTQEVARAATSYVGVLAMPSSYSETKPLVVEVDNLTFTEKRQGTFIVIY